MSRVIDISTPERPVMEIDGGVERLCGPVDLHAMGLVARVCRRCERLMSSEQRRVRIESDGRWSGTIVTDAYSGDRIVEVFSTMVLVGDDNDAVADVLANYLAPDGRVSHCGDCVRRPTRTQGPTC